MKAEINPKHAENIKPSEQEKHPCPTEEPGEKSERGNQVNGEEAVDVVLLPPDHMGVVRD
jgi:hypothetical protein